MGTTTMHYVRNPDGKPDGAVEIEYVDLMKDERRVRLLPSLIFAIGMIGLLFAMSALYCSKHAC